MEIIYKKAVTYKMIPIGDVFFWNGGLYMSIQEVTSKSTGELFNAISMRDGDGVYFYANDEVVPVKAQLVIS